MLFPVNEVCNQFVYPVPKGSELIILAPFRARLIRDNKFAGQVIIRILNILKNGKYFKRIAIL